jgi:hypothetical protein
MDPLQLLTYLVCVQRCVLQMVPLWECLSAAHTATTTAATVIATAAARSPVLCTQSPSPCYLTAASYKLLFLMFNHLPAPCRQRFPCARTAAVLLQSAATACVQQCLHKHLLCTAAALYSSGCT